MSLLQVPSYRTIQFYTRTSRQSYKTSKYNIKMWGVNWLTNNLIDTYMLTELYKDLSAARGLFLYIYSNLLLQKLRLKCLYCKVILLYLTVLHNCANFYRCPVKKRSFLSKHAYLLQILFVGTHATSDTNVTVQCSNLFPLPWWAELAVSHWCFKALSSSYERSPG